ncbi:uncharacterized protein LOC128203782 isoform X2 [Mya arenaria]|uniref:uncharacterized protein LOC128203782 isoform X2 n=1 Tax=Mya arenaria TaxID=6604 RepID=UPI0022E27161|nr:uncharacterized protein LOC128203782 isoform X2 [Mya arenaria]
MRLRLIRRAKWFVLVCLVGFVIFFRTQYNLQINTEDFTQIHVPHVQNESILVHEVDDPYVGSQQMQHNCSEWFEDNFHLNIERVKLYQNMHDKRVNNTLKSSEHFQDVRFPVIVTAASRDFFDISQGLIQSIYVHLVPKYEDVKLIYYDMGLTELQRNILLKHCNICSLVTFQFQNYPPHVRNLKTYTWKPLIVKELLQNFSWVWWADTSARFLSNDLDVALNYSIRHSILFFTYGESLSIAQHTDTRTMKYLDEDYCKFRYFGEVEASFVLFHLDDVTKFVVTTWSSCALVKECMCPPNANLACSSKNSTDGQCHRYDQSVLSIILRRLFHKQNNYPLVEQPIRIHTLKRGNTVKFFPTMA